MDLLLRRCHACFPCLIFAADADYVSQNVDPQKQLAAASNGEEEEEGAEGVDQTQEQGPEHVDHDECLPSCTIEAQCEDGSKILSGFGASEDENGGDVMMGGKLSDVDGLEEDLLQVVSDGAGEGDESDADDSSSFAAGGGAEYVAAGGGALAPVLQQLGAAAASAHLYIQQQHSQHGLLGSTSSSIHSMMNGLAGGRGGRRGKIKKGLQDISQHLRDGRLHLKHKGSRQIEHLLNNVVPNNQEQHISH